MNQQIKKLNFELVVDLEHIKSYQCYDSATDLSFHITLGQYDHQCSVNIYKDCDQIYHLNKKNYSLEKCEEICQDYYKKVILGEINKV